MFAGEASEFSHPDVVIGLTILAYRYEGFRETDYKNLMMTLQVQAASDIVLLHLGLGLGLLGTSWLTATVCVEKP